MNFLASGLTLYEITLQNQPSGKLPNYEDFSKTYEAENGCEGWFGRKVLAIPNFIISVTLKPIYHIGVAVTTLAGSLYRAVMKSEPVAKAFNTIDQDLFEAWGYFRMFFNDECGRYYTESSKYQKKENQKASEASEDLEKGKASRSAPPKAPPKPPPAPPMAPPVAPALDPKNASMPSAAPARGRGLFSTGKDGTFALPTLKRRNSQPDLKSSQSQAWEPFSIDVLKKQIAKIKKEKRSDTVREPGVSTPEGASMRSALESSLFAIRDRVTFSPQKPSPAKARQLARGSSHLEVPDGKQGEWVSPRTKILARKQQERRAASTQPIRFNLTSRGDDSGSGSESEWPGE